MTEIRIRIFYEKTPVIHSVTSFGVRKLTESMNVFFWRAFRVFNNESYQHEVKQIGWICISSDPK